MIRIGDPFESVESGGPFDSVDSRVDSTRCLSESNAITSINKPRDQIPSRVLSHDISATFPCLGLYMWHSQPMVVNAPLFTTNQIWCGDLNHRIYKHTYKHTNIHIGVANSSFDSHFRLSATQNCLFDSQQLRGFHTLRIVSLPDSQAVGQKNFLDFLFWNVSPKACESGHETTLRIKKAILSSTRSKMNKKNKNWPPLHTHNLDRLY
jgi:hypothetical protein